MGTLSQKDQENPKRRVCLITVLLEEIVYLTSIAKEVGQEYFLWKNMSIPREVPCTINETEELIERVNKKSHVSLKL